MAACVGFRLSQRELREMTGLIRERWNRRLNAWQTAGWVELAGESVTLSDVSRARGLVHDSEGQ